MEDLVLVAKLQRIITQRHDDVVTAMASGAVDNMEKYRRVFVLLFFVI